jgi:O-antigen/teichoic acid export membrane protein
MDKDFQMRFIKGVSYTGIGTFLQIFFGFIGFMVIARGVSKEQLGVFVLVQLIAAIFSIVDSFALTNMSVTKFIASGKDDQRKEAANTAICCKFLIYCVISIIILFCRPLFYYIFKSEELSRLILYIPFFFVLSSLDSFLLSILQGFHLYKKMAVAQVINSLIRLLLIIVSLFVWRLGILGVIYAFLLSYAASITYSYFSVPVTKHIFFNKELYAKMFKFGLPLGINNLLNFIFTKVDRLMIGAMINPTSVAYYETASKIPDNSSRMYESFSSVFFPHMSELFGQERKKEAERFLNICLRLVSFVTIFAALVTVLFQKEIVRLLFSERYLESAPAFALLMVTLNIALVGNIMGTTLVAAGHSDKPAKINIIMTVVNISGNLIMIPIFGFMGAVYATLISGAATNPFIVWFLRRIGIKVDILEYLKSWLVFLIFTAFFVIIGIKALMSKCLLLVIFLVVCLALSIIKKKDLLVLFKRY